MNDFNSLETLVKQLRACTDESRSVATLRQTREALEELAFEIPDAPKTLKELADALANLIDQIANQAVEQSATIQSLLERSIEVFVNAENGSHVKSSANENPLDELIDAIDVEASGGFDEDEDDWEDSDDIPEELSSGALRTANQLRRLKAHVESLANKAEEESLRPDDVIANVARQKSLIDAMLTSLQRRGTNNTSLLELELKFNFNETLITNRLHPAENWSRAVTREVGLLAKELSQGHLSIPSQIELNRAADRIEIVMIFEVADLTATTMREMAASLGMLDPTRQLDDASALQFALVSTTPKTNDAPQVFAPAAVRLHKLQANLKLESRKDVIRATLSLPSDLIAMNVKVFRSKGRLYAMAEEWISGIANNPKLNADAFDPQVLIKDQSYPLMLADPGQAKQNGPCLILFGDVGEFALMVNEVVENPINLVMPSESVLGQQGGWVRIDDKIAVLVHPTDFEQRQRSHSALDQVLKPHLVSLDERTPVSWFNEHTVEVRSASSERDTLCMMQEWRPIALIAPASGFTAGSALPDFCARHDIPTLQRKLSSGSDESQSQVVKSTYKNASELNEIIRTLIDDDQQTGTTRPADAQKSPE